MLINPRLHKGLFAVKEATMPYIQSAVHAFEPSYTKHPKQSFIGGTYQPLADESMTDTPLHFKARHRAELYTQKTLLRTEATHRSIYIPAAEASFTTCDTDIPAIPDEQHTSSFAAEEQVFNNNHALQTASRTLQTIQAALTTAGHSLKRTGHSIASAAHATARAARTAATTVHNAWHTFTRFKVVQLIIKFFQKAHGLWKKRMRFSYAFYTIVFTLLTSAEVIFLQWGMYTEPTYDKSDEVDQTTKILNSVAGQVTKFVSQIWLEQKYQFLLNFIGIGLIYLALVFVLNRFWIATVIFGAAMTAYGVANSIKTGLRNEPILPSDLSFVSNGNGGNLLSFIPKDQQALVNGAITVLIWFSCACLLLFVLDGRRCFIHCSWKHPSSNAKNIIGTSSRALAAILSIVLLVSYTWNLNIPGAWSYTLATNLGYKPVPWNTYEDAQSNGPATTFQSLVRVKAMDKPSGYSKKLWKR